MVVGRFGDHLPGYRLEDILSRSGVEIRRSTIHDWLAAMPDLAQPLYELMKQRVLQSKVIHTDGTQVRLIDTAIQVHVWRGSGLIREMQIIRMKFTTSPPSGSDLDRRIF